MSGVTSGTNWDAIDHATLYEWFGRGSSESVADSVRTWKDGIGARFDKVRGLIDNALEESDTTWEGGAAEAMKDGVSPLARFALDAKGVSAEVGDGAEALARSFDHIKNEMPPPVRVNGAGTALEPGIGNLFATRRDQEVQESVARQAEERARDLAKAYDTNVSSTMAGLPVFLPAPVIPPGADGSTTGGGTAGGGAAPGAMAPGFRGTREHAFRPSETATGGSGIGGGLAGGESGPRRLGASAGPAPVDAPGEHVVSRVETPGAQGSRTANPFVPGPGGTSVHPPLASAGSAGAATGNGPGGSMGPGVEGGTSSSSPGTGVRAGSPVPGGSSGSGVIDALNPRSDTSVGGGTPGGQQASTTPRAGAPGVPPLGGGAPGRAAVPSDPIEGPSARYGAPGTGGNAGTSAPPAAAGHPPEPAARSATSGLLAVPGGAAPDSGEGTGTRANAGGSPAAPPPGRSTIPLGSGPMPPAGSSAGGSGPAEPPTRPINTATAATTGIAQGGVGPAGALGPASGGVAAGSPHIAPRRAAHGPADAGGTTPNEAPSAAPARGSRTRPDRSDEEEDGNAAGYLQDTDDIWGDGSRVAPSVFGED
ncbi:hypothetical protein GCM10012275_17500 [Longimycelium tulufanense]|uniref:Uncharacterized protein n=1 Tax=Longimycelium tulufanense TaxID=907463 RepID=A0A8J3CCE0_9PSEU|nr:hypothetical protein GCM10012275_17500 [Longimycelium tulufanense]